MLPKLLERKKKRRRRRILKPQPGPDLHPLNSNPVEGEKWGEGRKRLTLYPSISFFLFYFSLPLSPPEHFQIFTHTLLLFPSPFSSFPHHELLRHLLTYSIVIKGRDPGAKLLGFNHFQALLEITYLISLYSSFLMRTMRTEQLYFIRFYED